MIHLILCLGLGYQIFVITKHIFHIIKVAQADTAIIATNKYLSFHFEDFFELTKCSRTRGNPDYKLYVKTAIRNYYKYSFFVCIV